MKVVALTIGLMALAQHVVIPVRPANPFVQSSAGKPPTLEISHDPLTNGVALTLSVRDRNGYFIPNLHPEDFLVEENGVIQRGIKVSVEHAKITLGVLVQDGSRYQELNDVLDYQLSNLLEPLIGALQPDDRVAVFAYSNSVRALLPLEHKGSSLQAAIASLRPSGFSESNLYDALISVSNDMRHLTGRRAILLISTGFDTFSHASFRDVLSAVERSGVPVYSFALTPFAQEAAIGSPASPLLKINWDQALDRLKTIAKVSGGRTYWRHDILDVAAVYDDMMEHLRVRYVLRYTSTNRGHGWRAVSVSLVDPQTRHQLRIVDEKGDVVVAQVSLKSRYHS